MVIRARGGGGGGGGWGGGRLHQPDTLVLKGRFATYQSTKLIFSCLNINRCLKHWRYRYCQFQSRMFCIVDEP